MNSIIKSLSDNGTFIDQDTLNYIMSKDNPEEFASYITKNLKEFPLVLTLSDLKDMENILKVDKLPKSSTESQDLKLIQTKMLSFWKKSN